MIFTDSKDSFKVNQILPILKEHFGKHKSAYIVKILGIDDRNGDSGSAPESIHPSVWEQIKSLFQVK